MQEAVWYAPRDAQGRSGACKKRYRASLGMLRGAMGEAKGVPDCLRGACLRASGAPEASLETQWHWRRPKVVLWSSGAAHGAQEEFQ